RRRPAGGRGRGRRSHEAGARHEHAAPEEEVASAEPVLLLVVLLVELDVILVAHVPIPLSVVSFLAARCGYGLEFDTPPSSRRREDCVAQHGGTVAVGEARLP